jgi:hypothetical protein
MINGFTSVPFKIDDNFSQVAGVAKFSRAGIVLEFESKLFGIIKSGVKEVRLALDEILDVKFKKGVFKRGARIEIRLKSLARLNEVPNRDAKITLKLERDDFERGAEAVERLLKDLSEHHESLPPTRTPVSRLFDESEDETQGKSNN